MSRPGCGQQPRGGNIAVCGGSGGSLLPAAAAAGADVLLTSDLQHHPVFTAGELGGPALCEVAHYASEWPWLPVAADLLHRDLTASVQVAVSASRTDPWTWHVGSSTRSSEAVHLHRADSSAD